MSDERVVARHCFVCGPDNPIGLRVAFELQDERCVGAFTPGDEHMGYDGVTHGGIIYSLLDDVMANWFFLRGQRGFTARAEVRYRQPVPVGTPLLLCSKRLRQRRQLITLAASARRASDHVVVAECEARFMLES